MVSDSARILTTTTPGSLEAAGTPFSGDAPAQWEFDVSSLVTVAAQHGIEVTGPPPHID